MTGLPNGEFHFNLVEREDRHGDKYLFAGLQILNAVIFIREEPTRPDEPRRFRAVLKPYTGRPNDVDETWNDSVPGTLGNQKEKTK